MIKLVTLKEIAEGEKSQTLVQHIHEHSGTFCHGINTLVLGLAANHTKPQVLTNTSPRTLLSSAVHRGTFSDGLFYFIG